MLLGRLAGWVLVAVAALMASADAVLALAPSDQSGLATSEMVTLLTGGTPAAAQAGSGLASWVLHMPAWIFIGLLGTTLLIAARKRPRRYRFRRG